ncbi:MAG: glycosyltransferase, partial [Candidatus Fimenecus sp.]
MKILMVSQHFYPDNFRINDIVKMLVEKGHSVTVLTSLPDYATGKVPADCKGLKNRKINWNGATVIRCFSVARRSGVLFRALNYFSFFLSSTIKARRLKEKFDVVMCYQTSPVLMANGARAAAKKQGTPFFIYCLD